MHPITESLDDLKLGFGKNVMALNRLKDHELGNTKLCDTKFRTLIRSMQ